MREALNTKDSNGQMIRRASCGVYAFFDYDGEPIYVGQTYENIANRIGRHLTGQRTDAVAKRILDPFEVAEIAIWPFWDLDPKADREGAKDVLLAAEYTVFTMLEKQSRFNAVLNEDRPAETRRISLPQSLRFKIVPDEVFQRRRHADVRIAQRASTLSDLANVISKREIKSPGIRRTLLTQAKRIVFLAERRLQDTE
ncbi:MAG: GIY-YIG nuclease family protein [Chloroflexi bacterium]|nr:GIY-YIG nuclease family protein [Chloroflexota bacterium]